MNWKSITLAVRLESLRDLWAETTDGVRIQLLANIEFPREVDDCLQRGADGVGLYRTEFLYLRDDQEPTEDVHFEAYSEVVRAMGDRPVVIRSLDLGAAQDNHCNVAPGASAGNTDAARSAYFSLNAVARKARFWMPGNAWLDTSVECRTNVGGTCNAYWSSGVINMYGPGNGCGNTGQLQGLVTHEWGHGMDQNAGGSASENGTGEAIGDSFAFIELRDPCIGENFLSSPCYNCNSSCTGVRDVSAYATGGISTCVGCSRSAMKLAMAKSSPVSVSMKRRQRSSRSGAAPFSLSTAR